jgi:streptogramin lyase
VAAEEPPRPRGRRRLIVLALSLAGAAAVAIALGLRDGGSAHEVVVRPNTVVRIDPGSNRIVDSIPAVRDPAALVATDHAVWVTSAYDSTLARIDRGAHSAKTVAAGVSPVTLARDSGGDIYLLSGDFPYGVWRIDPRTSRVARHYTLTDPGAGITVSGGSLWVTAPFVNALDRFDLDGGHRAEAVRVGRSPFLVTSGYGALWVANNDGTLSVIRPGVHDVKTIDGLRDVKGVAAGEGGVWVGSRATSAVTRLDPDTRRKVAEIPVARDPLVASGLSDIAVGAGSVWAVNRVDRTVVRIDPHTNKIVARIQLPGDTAPRSIDVAGNAVWVTVGAPTAAS